MESIVVAVITGGLALIGVVISNIFAVNAAAFAYAGFTKII